MRNRVERLVYALADFRPAGAFCLFVRFFVVGCVAGVLLGGLTAAALVAFCL